jgi:hypothetical protein
MSSAAFKPRADLVPSSALGQNFRTEDLPLAADHVNHEIPPETGQRKIPGIHSSLKSVDRQYEGN